MFLSIVFFVVPAGAQLPAITVGDIEWSVEQVENAQFDLADETLAVRLSNSKGAKFSGPKEVARFLLATCAALEETLRNISSPQVDLSERTFVQFTVEGGGEALFPYPVNIRLNDGACTGNLSFAMPTLSQAYSKHNPNDELFSVLQSWGLSVPKLNFVSGSSRNYIEVEIEIYEKFGRKISDINAMALCIHAIANLDRKRGLYGVIVSNLSEYTQINLQIVERHLSGVLNMRTVMAQTSFQLSDGLCVPMNEKK